MISRVCNYTVNEGDNVGIFKSLIPFSEEYLPPQLIDRESEMRSIERFLQPLKNNCKSPSNLFITGGVGVGKTTTARFVLASIPKTISSIHLTIAPNTTTYNLASLIAKSLHPDLNIKRSTDEMLGECIKRTKNPTLLVLDEIDRAQIGEVEPILHTLSRFGQFNMLIISRRVDALEALPEDTKSSLKCRETLLAPYTEETLLEILKQRAELGLQPNTVSEDALRVIANYAAYFGNARLAIDILYEAASLADSANVPKIDSACAKSAISVCERKAAKQALITLPTTHRIALESIVETLKFQPPTPSNVYYKWLGKLEKDGLPTFSIWKFYNVIAELEKLEFVSKVKHGKGRGRGVETMLQVPKHVQDVITPEE